MDIITGFAEKVKGKNFSIVLPEGNDERIIRAARIIKDEDIACPIVLGKPEKITDAAEKASVTLDGIETLNPRTSQKLDEHAQKYITGRDDISLPVAVGTGHYPYSFVAVPWPVIIPVIIIISSWSSLCPVPISRLSP